MADEHSLDHVQFRTSSYSGGGGCVEVGVAADGTRLVRNSRDREPSFPCGEQAWSRFVTALKADVEA